MEFTYKALKLSHDGLPRWDSMIPVVMAVMTESKQELWRGTDLQRAASDAIGLPDELRFRQSNTPEKYNVMEDRTSWSLSNLAISGLLTRPKRGLYQVTSLGRDLFAEYGRKLDVKVLHAQADYLQHQADLKTIAEKSGNQDEVPEAEANETEADIVNAMGAKAKELKQAVSVALLERIRSADPIFFERMVIDLLKAMGYQGTNGSSILTTATNDGGIDGIINQDPLGTQTVYVQAKRYQAQNTVQRPQIEAFFGALSRIHADRGVFITTSSFSVGAQETAKGFSIILIDGLKLASLLLKYHVGVQVRQTYEVLSIDEDYFEE